jgi:hypothetical protein
MKPGHLLFSILLGGAAAVMLNCREPAPTAPDLQVPALQASRVDPQGDLLWCRPLPSDSVTRTIGPEGGDIWVGPHRLHIPSGALRGPVRITAVTPSDTVNRIRFLPAGLLFGRPASLWMSYVNCRHRGAAGPKIAFTTDELQILDYLPSKDYPESRKVHGVLRHFSNYAVAW